MSNDPTPDWAQPPTTWPTAIAEITWDHWYQHRAELAEQGLSAGAPGRAADIDQPIAESLLCPRCGQALRYFPMHKPGEYRAFAVCLGCNVAAEF